MTKQGLFASVGFIGCGNMGGALIRQLAQGKDKPSIFVYDSEEGKAELCAYTYRIEECASASYLAQKSDLIVLAVKPQQLAGLLSSVAGELNNKVVVSIAAGVTLASLEKLAPNARIIRVMPNSPAQIGAGALAWTAANSVREDEKKAFAELFSASGVLFPLEENLMDAFTALAGSGPAYAFMLMNALAEGGVREGLDKKNALAMIAQTFLGAARMVLELGEHPEVLKDRVTSPGGTTAAGLAALETDAVRAACIKAVAAARVRASELGATK
jgi:pyrroline-5-carboxylate reductase